MVDTAASALGIGPDALRSALASTPHDELLTPDQLPREPRDSSSATVTLLVGWLSTVGDSEGDAPPPNRHTSAEVGLLRLTCVRESVVCSVSTDARPSPELLGCLVATRCWLHVPERGAMARHVEIDGPLVRCLAPRAPQPARPASKQSLTVGGAVAAASGGKARLLHVRGELTALSELCTSRGEAPSFFAELSDAEGGAATVVAFHGLRASRWRHVLRVGEEYVFTNLRQDVLDNLRGREADGAAPESHGWDRSRAHVLRSSGDHSKSATSVWRLAATSMPSKPSMPSMAPPPPPPPPRASSQLMSCAELRCASSQWDGYELSQGVLPCTQPETASEAAAAAAAAEAAPLASPQGEQLINYEGVVTRVLSSLVVELDETFTLLLSHAPTRPRYGLRRGATVAVRGAHTLPHSSADAAANGCAVAGFGLCYRGHIEILRHAPAAATAATAAANDGGDGGGDDDDAPLSSRHCITRQLSLHLNLAETLDYWQSLHASWNERWSGLLSGTRQAELLMLLLTTAPAGEAALFANLRATAARDVYREVFRHGRGCRLCAARAMVPHLPTLRDVASLPRVRQAMQRAQTTSSPQLLQREALGLPGRLPPLLIGELGLAAADAPAIVLRDATATLPVLLPAAHACLTDAIGRLWCLGDFELLVEPPSRQSPQPRLCVRCRLQPRQPPPPMRMRAGGPSVAAPGQRFFKMSVLESPNEDGWLSAAVGVAASEGGASWLVVPTQGLHALGGATTGGGGARRSFWAVRAPIDEATQAVQAADVEEVLVELYGPSRRWLPLLQPGQCYVVRGAVHLPLHHQPLQLHVRANAPDAAIRRLTSHERQRLLPQPLLTRGAPAPPLSVGGVLAAPRPAADEPTEVDLRCVLLERRLKREEAAAGGGGAAEASLQLRLGDGSGAQLEAYLDVTQLEVPPGLLVGSRLLVRRAHPRVSRSTGKLYLKLDATTEMIHIDDGDGATDAHAHAHAHAHRHGHAGAGAGAGAHAGAHRHAGGVAAADSMGSAGSAGSAGSGGPTLLSTLLSGCGARGGGVHRLHLSLRKIYSVELRWRCSGCNEIMCGRRCACGTAEPPPPPTTTTTTTTTRTASPAAARAAVWSDGRPRLFEVHVQAEVTDGSGVAYLDASGEAAWGLLQCSAAVIDGLRAAAAACGPLSHRHEFRPAATSSCLSLGTALWQCGAEQRIDDTSRAALARAVPAGARWHREFVCRCRTTRSASNAWKRDRFRLKGAEQTATGGEYETFVPEARLTLQALHVAPHNAGLELRRLLAGT